MMHKEPSHMMHMEPSHDAQEIIPYNAHRSIFIWGTQNSFLMAGVDCHGADSYLSNHWGPRSDAVECVPDQALYYLPFSKLYFRHIDR